MSKPIMSQPLGARVLLRVERSSEHSPGGVILPEDAREAANKGVILAVGPGEPLPGGGWQDVPLEVGDEVLFAPMSGVDMKIEGQAVRLVSFHDIVVNLKDAAEEELTDAQREQQRHANEPIGVSIADARAGTAHRSTQQQHDAEFSGRGQRDDGPTDSQIDEMAVSDAVDAAEASRRED